MFRKLNLKILITSVVTLLPVVLGLANDYFSSSLLLAIGVPVVFAAMNICANMYLDNYERIKDSTSMNVYHCRWVIPIISIISMSIVISITMNIESPIYYIIMSLIGMYICSSGIKITEFKKAKNSTFKLPSVLKNKSYSLIKYDIVGYIWIVGGLTFLSLVYLRVNWFLIFVLLFVIIYAAPLLIFQLIIEHNKQ